MIRIKEDSTSISKCRDGTVERCYQQLTKNYTQVQIYSFSPVTTNLIKHATQLITHKICLKQSKIPKIGKIQS